MGKDFEQIVEDIVEDEGTILQSEVTHEILERYDWSENYKKGSIRMNVSQAVKVLNLKDVIETEEDVYAEDGGRATRRLIFQGDS